MSFSSILQLASDLPYALKHKPYSVTSTKLMKDIKSLKIDFKSVIDGGANVGQFALSLIHI